LKEHPDLFEEVRFRHKGREAENDGQDRQGGIRHSGKQTTHDKSWGEWWRLLVKTPERRSRAGPLGGIV
jgi:hypothetical protein